MAVNVRVAFFFRTWEDCRSLWWHGEHKFYIPRGETADTADTDPTNTAIYHEPLSYGIEISYIFGGVVLGWAKQA